jgi:hypothetical protein
LDIKKVFNILIFLLIVRNISAQNIPIEWKPPPFPNWYNKLSESDKNRLWSIGITDYASGYVPSYAITDEEKKMISKHGEIWTYLDDYNVILFRAQNPKGRYIQVRISRYWL